MDFSDGLNQAWAKVGGWAEGFAVLLPNIIVGGTVWTAMIAIGFGVRYSLSRTFRRRGREDLGCMLADFVLWALVLFGLLLALTIILPSLKPGDLVAGLGVGSVAIGFAFKDILQNWLAGLLILMRQPFRRGDQIEMGRIEGTVQRITQRATLIKTYDGRVVVVPNADIYTQSITVNTAYEIRRLTIDITVGYEVAIDRVSRIIGEALRPIDDIRRAPSPQVLCWDLGPTSLLLKVRFWIDSRRSSEVAARARAVQAIKEAFQENDIDPTDPQIVYARLSRLGTPSPEEDDEPAPPKAAPPPRLAETPPSDPEGERPREWTEGDASG